MSGVRYDWSKLCTDPLRSILENLNAKDFHRARTVCSSWYSISTTCTQRSLHPWRILFRKSSTLLFDPEQDKTLETEHPGIDFSKSYVVASSSNWIFIIDYRLDLYLLNVFTCERINLPSTDTLLFGQANFYSNMPLQLEAEVRYYTVRKLLSSSKTPACLWMNERTGDYVAACSYSGHPAFSYKKGDDTWRKHKGTRGISMAYKNNKLYVFTTDDYVKVLDLSGDSDNEIVKGNPYRGHRFQFVLQRGECALKKKMAVTNSGEVLIVLSVRGLQEKRLFYIFKMNVESGKWERVDTLGGEVLIFGHGVMVRSPIKEIDGEGIKSDSICFITYELWPHLDRPFCGIFDLATSRVTWPKPLDDSFLKSLWFVPGYT